MVSLVNLSQGFAETYWNIWADTKIDVQKLIFYPL
jgi:hypothetical protein